MTHLIAMGFLTNRITVISQYLYERARYGTPEVVGPVGKEVLFILDGVGRFQIAPLMVRKILREQGNSLATVLYDWQFGLMGEVWTDLMWLRRNQVMAAKLARKLLAFRRTYPDTTIHVLAFSGGCGIAVFACEKLRGRQIVETLVLACPALSPEYNLAPALSAVRRCYALISRHDRWILGAGTRVFGTTDRRFSAAAGCVGFKQPVRLSDDQADLYARLQQLHWSPALTALGHHSGHTGWVSAGFLKRHLLPLLCGSPLVDEYEAVACVGDQDEPAA
ncbi:MAG: hypothetical protein JSU63_10865 [Phycisphaerales bacterium]|nr:MAG: hypothetical protein JSU63_10865 [Phycisphaerales bacterium]